MGHWTKMGQLHISKISTPNIAFKRRIDFASFGFSNNWFMKFICELLIWYSTPSRFPIKKLVNLIFFDGHHISDH